MGLTSFLIKPINPVQPSIISKNEAGITAAQIRGIGSIDVLVDSK